MGRRWSSWLVVAVLVAAGCRGGEPAPAQSRHEPEARTAQPEQERIPVSRLEEVVKTQPPGAMAERVPVMELLERATERQGCNRVMGCPAGEELIRLGTGAAGPIMARYREMPGWSYQRIHLLELLGRIGAGESVDLLVDQLAAPAWDARAQAAIALGRIGAKDRLELLNDALDRAAESDRGFRYALAFAMEKLGGIGGREILVAALDRDRVAGTNWGYTTVAAAAVGELGVTEACPLLVHSLRHRDVFLVRAALASAAALGCRDLAPEIRKLLKSPVPSIRREAERALSATGAR